jgi:hypothetical protein
VEKQGTAVDRELDLRQLPFKHPARRRRRHRVARLFIVQVCFSARIRPAA